MTTADAAYQDLFLHAPFGYLVTTPEGIVIRVNETALGWLGLEKDAVVGTNFADLLDTGTRLFFETRHQPVLLLKGEVGEVALVLRRADSTTMPVLANSVVVSGAEGQVEVRTALMSSSERQEYERSLLVARRAAEASEARVRLLQTSASAFIGSATETELAEHLVSSTIDTFDAASASVFLCDGDELRWIAGTERQPSRGGPVWLAVTSGQPVTIENPDDAAARYPQFVDVMREGRIDALTVIPLLDGGEAIGVLLCTFSRSRRFDEALVELQSALALQAAQVLVRQRLQAELQRLALHDPLTGLANRQLLHERATHALAAATRNGRSLAMLFFDLDGFKHINDRLGHTVGDDVLRQVGERVRQAVRSIDFVSRFGGDEFVVVCEDADLSVASIVGERIRAAIDQPLDGIALSVTTSVGAAVVESGFSEVSVDDLLERADAAMYASKQAGRNRVTLRSVG
ncbi:hypothetical protein BH11ACT3_BH11ACT3_18390 [soil metagenome]